MVSKPEKVEDGHAKEVFGIWWVGGWLGPVVMLFSTRRVYPIDGRMIKV